MLVILALGLLVVPLSADARVNAYVTGYTEPEPVVEEEIVNYNPQTANYNPVNYYSGNTNTANTGANTNSGNVSQPATGSNYNYGINTFSRDYESSANYSSETQNEDNVNGRGLAASVVLGSENSFLPSGLIQWVLLAIVIVSVIILVRKVFGAREEYDSTPLKHA